MKKTLQFMLVAAFMLAMSTSVFAQKKKVAYCTYTKTMDTAATIVTEDPIIKMLQADPNLEVTVIATTAAGEVISGLADYDVIVVQESFGSADAILQQTGSLALATMPKPFVYNKSYAFRSGKATKTSSAAAVEAGALTFTVEASALSHDLFKACTLGANNEIQVLNANTNDLGAVGTKSLNYTTGNVISASTLIAQPTGVTTAVIAINDMPAGTVIDSETLTNRMITIGMNFGSISANRGTNMTIDGLTIWRNAVYIQAGLPVPNTKVSMTTSVVTPETSARMISEKYYTVSGMLVRDPQAGIYIKKAYYENGVVKAQKVVFTQPLNR